MGENKLTRGDIIHFLEGYCAGHKFCIVGEERCKLLDSYCGGFMNIDDLPDAKLSEIYKYVINKEEIEK